MKRLRDRDAFVVLADIREAAGELERVFGAARGRLAGWSGGQLRSTNGGGTHGGGQSDPTASAAVAGGTDLPERWLAVLDDRAVRARDALLDLVCDCRRWTDSSVPVEVVDAWNRRCVLCDSHRSVIVAAAGYVPRDPADPSSGLVGLCEFHGRFRERYGTDCAQEISEFFARNMAASFRSAGFVHLLRAVQPELYLRFHAKVLGATGAYQDRHATTAG